MISVTGLQSFGQFAADGALNVYVSHKADRRGNCAQLLLVFNLSEHASMSSEQDQHSRPQTQVPASKRISTDNALSLTYTSKCIVKGDLERSVGIADRFSFHLSVKTTGRCASSLGRDAVEEQNVLLVFGIC